MQSYYEESHSKSLPKMPHAIANLDISSPLKCGEAFPCYSHLERSCSACELDTHALVGDQAAAVVLPVSSPSQEAGAQQFGAQQFWPTRPIPTTFWRTQTQQGSSMPGADPVTSINNACCLCSHYQTRLPAEHLHLQLLK